MLNQRKPFLSKSGRNLILVNPGPLPEVNTLQPGEGNGQKHLELVTRYKPLRLGGHAKRVR